jgi:hypothetical protein
MRREKPKRIMNTQPQCYEITIDFLQLHFACTVTDNRDLLTRDITINLQTYSQCQRADNQTACAVRKLFLSKTSRVATPNEVGGGERVRTDDLLLAKQVLSQLSYAPKKWWAWVDLNYRPQAYQACALTKLSYRPGMIDPDQSLSPGMSR